MQSEQNRVKSVISDTISLLCKSSLTYSNQLKIEGVIGVTVDGSIFLVHIDQEFTGSVSDVSTTGRNVTEVCHSLPGNEEQNSSHDDSTFMPVKTEPGIQLHPSRKPIPNMKVEPGLVKQESGGCNSNSSTYNLSQSKTPKRRRNTQRYIKESSNVVSIFDDESYVDDNQANYMSQENFDNSSVGCSFNQVYDNQEECAADEWSCEFNSTPPVKRKALGRGRGLRQARTSTSRRNMTFDSSSNSMVITESSHICGYNGCFKRFKFKHDLLRHQTKKHGRKPAFTRTRQPAGECNFVSSNGDEYYYDEEAQSNDGGADYDYGYQE